MGRVVVDPETVKEFIKNNPIYKEKLTLPVKKDNTVAPKMEIKTISPP